MNIVSIMVGSPEFDQLYSEVYVPAHTDDFDAPYLLDELTTALSNDDYTQIEVVGAHVNGEWVAVGWAEFPQRDNTELAYVELYVTPGHRRHGHGVELVDHLRAIVRGAGRQRILTEASWPVTDEEGPGLLFAKSQGFTVDLLDAIRDQPLPAQPVDAPFADGYQPIAWRTCPDEWIDQYAVLRQELLAQAPKGEVGLEPEFFDADRVRSEEGDLAEMGRVAQTVAVAAPDGGLVGHTQLVTNAKLDLAYQWDTLVLPEHRGHGLGLSLKARALSEAADLLDGVKLIRTWNAASNEHMIAVNEKLGYRQVAWTAELMGPA